MPILKTECFVAELSKPASKVVIAATFKDCDGNPLTPGVELVRCTDLAADVRVTSATWTTTGTEAPRLVLGFSNGDTITTDPIPTC